MALSKAQLNQRLSDLADTFIQACDGDRDRALRFIRRATTQAVVSNEPVVEDLFDLLREHITLRIDADRRRLKELT